MGQLVYVIVLNWNGKRFLDDCLSSVTRQTYSPYKVMVVDNNSTDGSVEFIRKAFPTVEVMELPQNLEFAAGNNAGIRKVFAKGVELIALLNNDTRVDARWLELLVNVMQLDERIGICASKMFLMHNPTILDSTGHVFQDGFIRDRGTGEYDRGQYDAQTIVVGSCAGATLYRRKMFESIGLFDETFGFFYEDADLSWRAFRHGWQARFVPQAIVYHVRGGSVRSTSEVEARLTRKGRVNFFRLLQRHASLRQRLLLTLIWCKEMLRDFFVFVMKGKKNNESYPTKIFDLWFRRW